MNKLPILFFVLFFGSSVSFAQEQPVSQQQPIATKGYHTISTDTNQVKKKAVKLKQGSAPKVTKGYYSIGDHNKKLPKPTTVVISGSANPTAEKGYYRMKNDSLPGKSPE